MTARGARPEDRRPAETRRIPAARTERLPIDETEEMPVSSTEKLPEARTDSTTTPMRQVRSRTEDGPWPAIPMLPVIRPEDVPVSEVDRVRESRGVQALQRYLEFDRKRDPDAPAWPERDDPDA